MARSTRQRTAALSTEALASQLRPALSAEVKRAIEQSLRARNDDSLSADAEYARQLLEEARGAADLARRLLVVSGVLVLLSALLVLSAVVFLRRRRIEAEADSPVQFGHAGSAADA